MSKERIIWKGKERLILADKDSFHNVDISKEDSGCFLICSESVKEDVEDSRYVFFDVPWLNDGLCWYSFGPVYAWVIPKKVNRFNGDINKIQFLLLSYDDGLYGAFFPLQCKNSSSFLAVLNYKLRVETENRTNQVDEIPILAMAFHDDPYQALENVIDYGLINMGRTQRDSRIPGFFKSLGWCSWNAFGHEVNHKRMIDAARSFNDKGIAVRWMLLDDGWMDISGDYGSGKLRSMSPNSEKFPFGLRGLISDLKANHQIEKVGIWLTLSGYWGGIDPESELFVKNDKSLICFPYKVPWSNEDTEISWFSVGLDGKKSLFDAWFSFLKDEGVDFVKIDHQNIIDDCIRLGKLDFFSAGKCMQHIVQLVDDIFGPGHVIHCMGVVPQAYFNTSRQGITRISEDYFPHNFTYNPLAGNAAVHAINNFSTALWIQHLVNSDADMFQSSHQHSFFHAAIRFLTGGLIYSTDYPGTQDVSVYSKLVDKAGVLKRFGKPAQPIPKCIFQLYEAEPYIVFVNDNDVSFVGIFNVADAEMVTGTWCCNDIPNMEGESFRLTDWMTDNTFVCSRTHIMEIRLERMGFQLLKIERF